MLIFFNVLVIDIKCPFQSKHVDTNKTSLLIFQKYPNVVFIFRTKYLKLQISRSAEGQKQIDLSLYWNQTWELIFTTVCTNRPPLITSATSSSTKGNVPTPKMTIFVHVKCVCTTYINIVKKLKYPAVCPFMYKFMFTLFFNWLVLMFVNFQVH